MGLDPSTSIHQNPPISEQPQKDSTSLEKDEKIVISEPREIGEAETISNTIENKVEETTTTTATDTKGENVKIQHSSESFTEKVPNLFQLKYESEKKQNQVLDILQKNLKREETDDADENTVEAENNVETTTLNRRLPEFYPGIHRKKTTMPPRTKPQVINHNMNLQTALIINTLSKVLPNVPQSRLKNQPRLENVGSGMTFHQEELFIFHSTLTELQNILDKSLRRGGLPNDLMVSIFAAKEHNLALVSLFYRLIVEAEYSADQSVTITQEDSRTFAKHFHFLRAIFPFL